MNLSLSLSPPALPPSPSIRWLLESTMRAGSVVKLTVVPCSPTHNALNDDAQYDATLSPTIELPLTAPGRLTRPLVDEPDASVSKLREHPKPLPPTPTESFSRGSNPRLSLHDNPRYAPSVGSRESSNQSLLAEMVESAARVARVGSRKTSRRRKVSANQLNTRNVN